MWREVTSQSEIEALTIERNKRHLQQTAMEEGVSTKPPLTTLRENFGFNEMARQVLEGTYELTGNESAELVAFLEAIKQTDKEKACRPVLGTISSEEFQAMFQVKPEKTSSDTRTLNYTIWKCISRSNYLSSIFSVMISLPFTYGFMNSLWSFMTDFMIEKKRGKVELHLLRIIGKVAAEFNTALSFLIGKQAAKNFESCDPCGEQHGSRPKMGSPDAAMIKLLTFECLRLMRETGAMIQHDCSAHFDRIYPANTNIFATKVRVSKKSW